MGEAELDSRYLGAPNRREALRGEYEDGLALFVVHAIAKKLYRCARCGSDIPIGSEHAIISKNTLSKYTHDHIDFNCLYKNVLPSLVKVRIINPSEASGTKMNKRNRKYRNEHRHQ